MLGHGTQRADVGCHVAATTTISDLVGHGEGKILDLQENTLVQLAKKQTGRQTIWCSKTVEIPSDTYGDNIVRTVLNRQEELLVFVLVHYLLYCLRSGVYTRKLRKASRETVWLVMRRIKERFQVCEGPICNTSTVADRLGAIQITITTKAQRWGPNRGRAKVLPVQSPVPIAASLRKLLNKRQ